MGFLHPPSEISRLEMNISFYGCPMNNGKLSQELSNILFQWQHKITKEWDLAGISREPDASLPFFTVPMNLYELFSWISFLSPPTKPFLWWGKGEERSFLVCWLIVRLVVCFFIRPFRRVFFLHESYLLIYICLNIINFISIFRTLELIFKMLLLENIYH